jgi:hypothetical protein
LERGGIFKAGLHSGKILRSASAPLAPVSTNFQVLPPSDENPSKKDR